jgi:hypothetical protein
MGARNGAFRARAAREMRSGRSIAYGEPVEATRPSQQGYWFHPVITDNSLQFSLEYPQLDLVFFERLPFCVPAALGNG